MCDTHTAYGHAPSKADFQLAIINVNIWRVPPLNCDSTPCGSKAHTAPQLENNPLHMLITWQLIWPFLVQQFL